MSHVSYKKGVFSIDASSDDEVIHVEIAGLGIVSITRTSEGVSVDAFDNTNTDVPIACFEVLEADFCESFAENVNNLISQGNDSVVIDTDFVIKSYKNGLSDVEVVNQLIDMQKNKSLLEQILLGDELTEKQFADMKALGFECYQDGSGYTDLELSVQFESKEDNGDDDYSFDAHFVFNWEESEAYIVLGTNMGDGWNDYYKVGLDGREFGVLVKELLDSKMKIDNGSCEYLSLLRGYHEAHEDIITGLDKIYAYLCTTKES